ncbi:MAG: polyphosphate kinase 2 [SAR324 cluster bacterium]|jgi:polyphosphate kinase 2|nr:polyphosphate kinase 2 [Deltaproteobacteria bacterium]MAE00829.1 polyphosphate kinase 2 [Pseudomonadota bacterium]MDP6090577.1 polyphosphate kinase 2 [SAR324 cluster bacterium]MBI12178.1 polyphosphate kinase 2 [Deltaproteobacteria bacterium]MDP6247456.1 polyphosphate kinase 2 [SAR324 cluster bacterium]|tara:strand:- start:1638 stop:2492 length:855 start_codon:yes stop_codon:yes gene_type:complete
MSKKEKHKEHHSHKNENDKGHSKNGEKLPKKEYEEELSRLQLELVKMQTWVQEKGLKLVLIFEGRDAAGKGGTIKRITEPLNPRGCKVVALGKPSDTEKTQWYFQRYVAHLPSAGEIVIFDRSWYNRGGVEKVMGFCSGKEYEEFSRSVSEFEGLITRSGILLIKYWFSVSSQEQEKRFQERVKNPAKRWKLSPMDMEARNLWDQYSEAKDAMFEFSNMPFAPWYTVEGDDKHKARLNCIHHLLSKVHYKDVLPRVEKLPKRKKPVKHVARPPKEEHLYVPEVY